MRALVIASMLTLALVEGHVGYWNSANNIQPVKGLYVKSSVDGTTGDLYVAATEDSGAKTQWLIDSPINFLPAAATAGGPPAPQRTQTSSLPTQPHEEAITTNHKRAILASPPFKFNYAAPVNDGNTLPFNYAFVQSPITTSAAATETKECSKPDYPATASYATYTPYHYYYPQMLAALLSGSKDSGAPSEDSTPKVQQGSVPYWPQAYSYPIQYVMVNPAAWVEAQAPITQSSPTQTAVQTISTTSVIPETTSISATASSTTPTNSTNLEITEVTTAIADIKSTEY